MQYVKYVSTYFISHVVGLVVVFCIVMCFANLAESCRLPDDGTNFLHFRYFLLFQLLYPPLKGVRENFYLTSQLSRTNTRVIDSSYFIANSTKLYIAVIFVV